MAAHPSEANNERFGALLKPQDMHASLCTKDLPSVTTQK